MTGNNSLKIGGILLAAGGSSRMRTPKQFVEFEGKTLLRRAAEAMSASICDPVIAVLGDEDSRAENELSDLRFELRFNHEWKSGMSSSIKLGLRELVSLEPDIDAVLITLCDQVFVDTQAIHRLTDRYLHSQSRMVAAMYGNVIGVPAIFPRDKFEQLMTLVGDKGARELLRDPDAAVETVEIEEAAADIDTFDDLNRLKSSEH
jgi:molybdenum cofactor cytidylyltransferase